MKFRTRTFYTEKQKSEMWDRWQRGESLSSISRRFDRASSSIFPHLAVTGGIRPPERTRSGRVLSLAEREEISRGLAASRSLRSIARDLSRSSSTISREVRRNGGRKAYRAALSDQHAWDCARRPKACKLSFNEALCCLIARKLRLKWSPKQIEGWLMRRPHRVPLPNRAVALLKELHRISGTSSLLYPSVRSLKKPISENKLEAQRMVNQINGQRSDLETRDILADAVGWQSL